MIAGARGARLRLCLRLPSLSILIRRLLPMGHCSRLSRRPPTGDARRRRIHGYLIGSMSAFRRAVPDARA